MVCSKVLANSKLAKKWQYTWSVSAIMDRARHAGDEDVDVVNGQLDNLWG
jgi:hypothetical protein